MSSNPEAAGYPGNPSLPREVREKILSTFRHTLNLYHEGKADDCVIGCDFILKMDPRFTPARRLMDKAKNPAAAVDVAELEALVATTPTRQERVGGAQPDQQLVRAVESYNARDFDAAIAAAEKVLAVLPGNRDALEILDKAAGKKASQPLFEASRQRALAALEAGRMAEAKQELDRMRGFDPDHPAVALLERRIQPSAPRPPTAPPSPKRTTDEVRFDVMPQEPSIEFGGMSREPDIAFDDGATVALKLDAPPPPPTVRPAAPAPAAADGLASLSLDSLSLDLPPPVPPVSASRPVSPASHDDTSPGLHPLGSAPPPPPAGSPMDFWQPAPPGMELEEVAAPPPRPAAPRSAAPPPPPPAAAEEDESQANEREITTLLKQGDEAARRGNRQQAIEIWSRIFLIDINNSDAVTRIEKARQEMAEGNRVISDALKTGREKFEAGDFTGAREHFLQVLALDESEATARFYIDRIEEELSRAASGQPSGSSAGGARETPSSGVGEAAAGAAPARAAKSRSASKGFPINTKVLGIAAVAVLATAIGAYFFVLRSPKSSPGPASKPGGAAASSASLAHARELLSTGKIGEARAELRKIPASSPDSAEARRMLAEMEGQTAAAGATPAPGGPAVSIEGGGAPPPVVAANDPANLRAAGEKALAEKRYIDALKAFNQAKAAFKNDPTFSQAMGVAADKVATLAPAVKLYNEAEYETVIPMLWRIHQEDRDNQDARSYLLRAYYNQGITQLQNQLYPKAIQSFDEALALDPKDQEIIRHRKFAEHYLKGDLDLMGRIYVRHLNHRP
jgi:tetratricopeptide (TPR) repeat protein